MSTSPGTTSSGEGQWTRTCAPDPLTCLALGIALGKALAAAPRSSAFPPSHFPAPFSTSAHTQASHKSSLHLEGSLSHVAKEYFHYINDHRDHRALTSVSGALGHMPCRHGSHLISAAIHGTQWCALGVDLLSLEGGIQIPATWLLKLDPCFIQPH